MVGRSMVVSRKKTKTKEGIRWVEEDGKTARDVLLRTGRRNLHRASWPKYRIEKDLPYGNRARSSPFSVPIFVRDAGDRVEVQVGPRPGKNLRCDVVSVLLCKLTVDRSVTHPQ